ncbi:unnamed protein product, partial [Peniophora sp. CBMAI 1063]
DAGVKKSEVHKVRAYLLRMSRDRVIDASTEQIVLVSGSTHIPKVQQLLKEFFSVKQYQKKTSTDISKNLGVLGKLKREVEKAKHTLSAQQSTRIEIEAFENDNDFSKTLTRAKFEELNMDLFRRTMKPVKQVLKDAGVKKSEVQEVRAYLLRKSRDRVMDASTEQIVLVSGSTHIPKVQQLLKAFFSGRKPSKGPNPDEAVAQDTTILDGILSGDESLPAIVLVNVCPLTHSIETTSSVVTKVILRNMGLLTHKSLIFSTATDNQPTVLFQVYEGERLLKKENNSLGQFELSGIPPSPRGASQFEGTFEVDTNGTMKVSAADKGTYVPFSSMSCMSALLTFLQHQDNIERMIREAEEFAAGDEAQQTCFKALNSLSSFVYTLQLQLNLLALAKEITDWLNAGGNSATAKELEEKFQNAQAVLNLITPKMYESAGVGRSGGDEEQDPFYAHDEPERAD